MAVFVLPGVVQCVPVMSNGDYKASCVLAFGSDRTTDYTVADLGSLAARFDAAWSPVWTAYGSSDSTYLGCDVFDLNSATSQSLMYGALTPVAGTKGGSMGAQVSVLISHKLPLRYKGGRPRTYLPYVGQTVAFSGDTLLDEYLDDIQAAFSGMKALMNTSSVGVGPLGFGAILNRRHAGGATFHNLATSVTQDRFATQRRRLRKVNRHR